MRNIFLTLLLINILMLAWQSWHVSEPLRTRSSDSVGREIVLLSEAGPEDFAAITGVPDAAVRQEVPQAAAAPEVEQRVSAVCRSAGPFMTEDAALAAAQVLTEEGLETSVRPADGQVWLGQWVYIESIETQAEAGRIADIFREAGVTEAYVIGNGDGANIVSLGVFQQSSRAEQRANEARALDFEPIIADQSRAGTVFRVDVVNPGGDVGWLSLIGEGSPVEIGLTGCEP